MDTVILLFYYYSGLNTLKNKSAAKILRIKSGKSDKDVILLKIPIDKITASAYNRLDDSEFIYEGKLYDIISEKSENDTLYIKCIHDEAEQNFNKKIALTLNEENDKWFSSSRAAASLNLKSILPDKIIFPPLAVNINISFSTVIILKNPCIDIPSPPPKNTL